MQTKQQRGRRGHKYRRTTHVPEIEPTLINYAITDEWGMLPQTHVVRYMMIKQHDFTPHAKYIGIVRNQSAQKCPRTFPSSKHEVHHLAAWLLHIRCALSFFFCRKHSIVPPTLWHCTTRVNARGVLFFSLYLEKVFINLLTILICFRFFK